METPDVSTSLRRIENLLRDTISNVLSRTFGDNWINQCGVTPERVERWRSRSAEDERKRGARDPRLIYYSDFYDLKTLIRKNWNHGLSEVLLDLKELEALLTILEEMRNPEAHRREFMPFETHLVEGISGRIRSRIVRHYSLMETSEAYYPRFEFAQDSLGNAYSIGQGKAIQTKTRLRPGDELQFKLVASDPLGESLEYLVHPNALSAIGKKRDFVWNPGGEFAFQITNEYVGSKFIFVAHVRSQREFHATSHHVVGPIDDELIFSYEILPPRST